MRSILYEICERLPVVYPDKGVHVRLVYIGLNESEAQLLLKYFTWFYPGHDYFINTVGVE